MLSCPECKSPKLIKAGLRWTSRQIDERGHTLRKMKTQQYQCQNCGHITVHPLTAPTRDDKGRFIKPSETSTIPKDEQWLYDNAAALKLVKQGLKDAAQGKVSLVPNIPA